MKLGPILHRLLVNRWLGWLLVLPLAAMIVLTTLQYRKIEAESGAELGKAGSMLIADAAVSDARILNDYEDFYVVGRLFREGDIVRAYDNDYLTASQQRFTGSTTFMPWAYPPPLTAMMPVLPMLGLAWSYLLFMATTLALYLWTLSRFGWERAGAGLLAVYPALVLCIRLGQNGLLTGSLIGLTLLGLMHRRNGAGVPLGLMVIKPHLALGPSLLALLQRRWAVLAIAAVTVALTCALATGVLGIGVWSAFLAGVKDAGGYLREGLYPLYRMSSVYAGVRSFGFPPEKAMAIHILVAVAALGLLALGWSRGLPANRLMALAAFVTLFVSPYNYDYDLACLAAAVMLVLPELLARARWGEVIAFYALAWIGTGSGLAQHFRAVLLAGTTQHPHGSSLNWSLQAAGLLLAGAYVALILRRRPSFSAVGSTAGQGRLARGIA